MKKLTGILLALILCFSILMNAVADDNASSYKITINGVNVAFTDGKTVLEPMENDGVLYVPLESFLKAMNISYQKNNGEYIITTASEAAKPEPVVTKEPSAYSQLSSAEKEFLNIFLKHVTSFNNPSSVVINKVYKNTRYESSVYYVSLNAQNQMGGNSNGDFFVSSNDCFQTYAMMDQKDLGFSMSKINKALKEKLQEKGYN